MLSSFPCFTAMPDTEVENFAFPNPFHPAVLHHAKLALHSHAEMMVAHTLPHPSQLDQPVMVVVMLTPDKVMTPTPMHTCHHAEVLQPLGHTFTPSAWAVPYP